MWPWKRSIYFTNYTLGFRYKNSSCHFQLTKPSRADTKTELDQIDIDIARYDGLMEGRRQVADEIHSNVNSLCYSLRHHLGLLERHLDGDSPDLVPARIALDEAKAIAAQLYSEGRSLARRHEAPASRSLRTTLESIIESKQRATSNIKLELGCYPTDDDFEMRENAIHALQLVVEEAVMNSIKYAACKLICIKALRAGKN